MRHGQYRSIRELEELHAIRCASVSGQARLDVGVLLRSDHHPNGAIRTPTQIETAVQIARIDADVIGNLVRIELSPGNGEVARIDSRTKFDSVDASVVDVGVAKAPAEIRTYLHIQQRLVDDLDARFLCGNVIGIVAARSRKEVVSVASDQDIIPVGPENHIIARPAIQKISGGAAITLTALDNVISRTRIDGRQRIDHHDPVVRGARCDLFDVVDVPGEIFGPGNLEARQRRIRPLTCARLRYRFPRKIAERRPPSRRGRNSHDARITKLVELLVVEQGRFDISSTQAKASR